MLALFVLFPRLPGPLWAIQGTSTSGTSGLGDTVNPGDITSLALSDEIAFRAQFLSAPPRAGELYWRGPTMTNFDGRTWSILIGDRRGERVDSSIDYLGAPTEYRVMLETSGRNWAFALEMPKLAPSERMVRMGSDYQLRTFPGTPRGTRLDYRLTSYTTYRAREPLTADEQNLFRRLPPDSSPRTRELVRGWLTDRPSPEELIERGLDYLRSQPFFYTLTPPALGNQPVDEFLFDTREGFCEHYASAFTVMMRAAGLPARVVTGYQGGELNGVGGYYIIRQSDAHAWTEVWLADRGWIRVDPVAAVAPDRVALGSLRGALAGERLPGSALGRIEWVRRAMLFWDAATTYWNEWVIGYGPELQRALLDALGFDDAPRAERWSKLILLCVGATLAGSVLVSLQLAWRRRRRTAIDEAAREFATFTKRLARLEVGTRAPSEGPVAYGARAQSRLPHAATEIAAIVSAYLRARYERDADRSALAELRARVASFRPARA
jgi:transglutaminase-like putative cysteine protease